MFGPILQYCGVCAPQDKGRGVTAQPEPGALTMEILQIPERVKLWMTQEENAFLKAGSL
jgi:hypothetical protein